MKSRLQVDLNHVRFPVHVNDRQVIKEELLFGVLGYRLHVENKPTVLLSPVEVCAVVYSLRSQHKIEINKLTQYPPWFV